MSHCHLQLLRKNTLLKFDIENCHVHLFSPHLFAVNTGEWYCPAGVGRLELKVNIHGYSGIRMEKVPTQSPLLFFTLLKVAP